MVNNAFGWIDPFVAVAQAAAPLHEAPKYTFPTVVITGTQISCGLRPIQLSPGVYHPWGSYENMLFGMCFFSKYTKLHSRYKVGAYDELQEVLGGAGIFGPNPINVRHYVIEPKFGYVMSTYNYTLTAIEKYIKDNDLGVTYRTPDFKNKKYGDTGSIVGVMVWHWNGKVPPVPATLVDFPYNQDGTKK